MSTNVEQIKERLNIVDVISSYIKVEKAGINFKAKCPFHNEKTPSFFISPTRQSFYCFGCGEKGDIFSFVEKFEGLDFKGALETLANRAGIELKNFRKEGRERPEEKDKLFEIMEEAAKFYERELTKNKKVLEYLRKRGLSSSSISKWRIGFAPDGWRNTHDYLTQKGFSKENMFEGGLIKRAVGADGNRGMEKYYDTFRNRVMFPICDDASRVIAFSGRAMKEDDKTPKYLNSPETKLFYKSEVLYGFNVAKNHIRKLDYAVLVEGQMDLIMSNQAGVLNTVASSGTALTELHLKKIQKLSNRVIIAYDSDPAGEKASRRAAELALFMGMETKITSLPKGEDPASVAKEDPKKWKSALKEAEHFTDFALNKAVKENEGRNLLREIMKNILPLANLIKSNIEKTQFVKKIALKMRVGEEAVWNDLKKIKTEDFEITETFNNYKDEKEALIFEAEKYGLKIDIKKTNEDILRKNELKNLKQKLQETAILLDDKNISKTDEKKIKSDFEKIQKRIKELNN
ncbi:MAG: DNA primase [Candidatus Zambryskibacteria bacterium]